MRSVILFVFALLVTSGPATAITASAWQEKTNARARLIAAEVDGTAYAAVEIELKPGWHTYWRYPGASGVAPELDFTMSENAEMGTLSFAAAYFFDDGVGGVFGYDERTGFVAPLSIPDAARPSTLRVSAFVGICREICVPVTFELSLQMPAGALIDPRLRPAIGALLAAQPMAPSDKLMARNLTFDGARLQMVVTGSALTKPDIMLVPGPHDVLGQPQIMAADKDAVIFEIPAWSKLDHPLIGRKLNFIIRDGDLAIEQQLNVIDHRLLSQEK